MTNDKFAETDVEFRAACQVANIPPTRRQASKWRNEKGKAYKQGRFLLRKEKN